MLKGLEARMRDKTGTVLANHRLVKEFHEYREYRRQEQDSILQQLTEQQRETQYKKSLLPAAFLNPSDDHERLRIENKKLRLDCYRVQQMIIKKGKFWIKDY